MAKTNLVWTILPRAPEAFFDMWQEVKTTGQFDALLVHAEKCGWVKIHGVTDKHPKDILAVLQEFYDVKHVSLGGKDGD